MATPGMVRLEHAMAAPGAAEPRVVVIDDHEIVLDGLSRALPRAGLRVAGAFMDAASAVQFLQSAGEDGPDVQLAVVDLRLGAGSSIALIETICRAHPGINVAVLTSSEDHVAAAAAVRAGARGFLLKDMPSGELGKSLRSVAEGHPVIDSRMTSAVLAPQETLLSDHELAILRLVADGLTNREISAQLHLSPNTVKNYLSRVMRKLGTSTRAETVVRALMEGLVSGRE